MNWPRKTLERAWTGSRKPRFGDFDSPLGVNAPPAASACTCTCRARSCFQVGTQQQRDRQRPAQPVRIGAELAEGGRCRAEEHLVDQPRALTDQCVQRMRQGEREVEIRHRQQFLAPLRQPVLLGTGLALRAVAVAARVMDVSRHAAAVAGLDVAAEHGRATGDDRPPDLGFDRRQGMPGEDRRPVTAENLGQRHGRGLRRAGRAVPGARRCRSPWRARDAECVPSSPGGHGRAVARWCRDRRRLGADAWRRHGAVHRCPPRRQSPQNCAPRRVVHALRGLDFDWTGTRPVREQSQARPGVTPVRAQGREQTR